MLKVENIYKSFGSLKVLNGISFSADKGEVIAIIGPSGMGKSTLLRCINLLEEPDSGSIEMKKEVFLLEECLIHSMESIEDNLRIKGLLPQLSLNGIKIKGDFYWLSEAFLNIIKNFSDLYPKVKNISISAKDNAVYTQVSFENDGPKIPASSLRTIFRRFYKGQTNEGNGFGIGLAMSQTILKKHNAEIRAENTKSGTVFIVKFYKE